MVEIKGKTYYLLKEVCRETSINRSTLLRWPNRGVIEEPIRDRRGWRIFSRRELEYIRKETERTSRV